jgi:hypothetical protein
MLYSPIQNDRANSRKGVDFGTVSGVIQAPMAQVKGWKTQQRYRFTTAHLDGKTPSSQGNPPPLDAN